MPIAMATREEKRIPMNIPIQGVMPYST